MDSNGGIRGRLERGKLSLPKRTSETTQNAVIPTMFPTYEKVGGSRVSPILNRESSNITNSIQTPVSILKRVRRFPRKENDSSSALSNKVTAPTNLNFNSPNNKRVRIFTPLEESMSFKQHSVTYTPNKTKSRLNDEQNVVLSNTCNLFANNHLRERESLAVEAIVTNCERNMKRNEDDDKKIEGADDDAEFGVQRNRRRNIKDFKHWLLIRFQPKVLSDAIKSLTPHQKKWVKETGFGSLLSFRMNEYPQALCYYLALNFIRHRSSLCFDNKTIPIADDDVHEILGLPKGKNRLVFLRNTHTEDLWRSQFTSPERLGWKVTAKMVCEAIKKSDTLNRMFKLNFLVLMSNILIEGPTNPYVKQTMLSFAGDLDECNQYNWCEYLISQLKIASVAWNENPANKRFTGSMAFLVYLYMDRVVKGKRKVRRKKPTYIGWSDTLILDRQISDISSNTLFTGRIALPLRYKDSDDESSYEDCTWNTEDGHDTDGEEVDGQYVHNTNISSKQVSCDVLLSGVERNKNESNKDTINQIQDSEVPRYVIDQLKDSLDGYENFQIKCMHYLLSARELFKNNSIVNSLESKFIDLIKKSDEFISNNLNGRTRDFSAEKQIYVKSSPVMNSSKENSGNVKDELLLDDDLLLSKNDWDYIDSLSIPSAKTNVSSSMLFNSMESQSKSLTIRDSNNSSGFKTPSSVNLFKVPLDASIPSFDLGVDNIIC